MTAHSEFVALTEMTGDEVSREQIERLARRYYWAADYCRDRDVLEVACGSAQGAGYLSPLSRYYVAGDISEDVLAVARRHYRDRFQFRQLDAQDLPFPDGSFDVVMMFEAIYYVPDPDRFFAESHRILRDSGRLLIVSANKDLFDFTPSPLSHRYFGVAELNQRLGHHGFDCAFFGDTPVAALSVRQRVLRPIKAMASKWDLIPHSMNGKKFLKRLVFGELQRMPGEITAETAPRVPPTPLDPTRPDTGHKVIYCAATRRS